MKKLFFAIPLACLALVACDPSTDGGDAPEHITATELTQGLTIQAESAGNNNLTIYTNPVQYIWVYDNDTKALVGNGTSVSVQVVPPARTVSYYVTTMGMDGTTVMSDVKSIDVKEFTKLPEIYNKIFEGDGQGNFKKTTWTWDTEASDGVWGNGGYMESTGPGWWIVSANDIDEQASEKGLAEDGLDGWFSLDLSTGVNTSRGETGQVSVNENTVKAGWDIGTMKFSGTIPLMGILVNQGNQKQYEYQILQADGTHLRLCAPEPGAGDWGTAWFWNFKKK